MAWSFLRMSAVLAIIRLVVGAVVGGYAVLSKIDDIPSNEMAPIYEAFIDWKNQRFLDDLSADVERGLGHIVEHGYWPGGVLPMGYRAVQEAVAEQVALAWRLKLEGNASYQEIHEATQLYSK